jgi:capsule polysaccharide export protein KpsC/LpsZ
MVAVFTYIDTSIFVKERMYYDLITMFNRVLLHMPDFVIWIKQHNSIFCSPRSQECGQDNQYQ